jgi:hypothetical protein
MSTKVLSARIPSEALSSIDKICKERGISRSNFIVNSIADANADKIKLMKRGGVASRTIPLDVQNMLSTTGAVVTGISAFNIVGDLLDDAVDRNGNKMFSEIEVQIGSIVAASIVGLLASGLIKSLMK